MFFKTELSLWNVSNWNPAEPATTCLPHHQVQGAGCKPFSYTKIPESLSVAIREFVSNSHNCVVWGVNFIRVHRVRDSFLYWWRKVTCCVHIFGIYGLFPAHVVIKRIVVGEVSFATQLCTPVDGSSNAIWGLMKSCRVSILRTLSRFRMRYNHLY